MEGTRGGGEEGRREGGEEEELVQFPPTVFVTTYWYHIILLIDDFNVHLHVFVCSFCSFGEHPGEDGQIYIVVNIIC